MNEIGEGGGGGPDLPPAAKVKERRRLSVVWFVPIVAGVVAGWLAINTLRNQGPQITITFETAEGLQAGTTKIKFKEVDVGTVENVTISEDLSRIVVTARMVRGAAPYMNTGTRFWIVRPRVGTGGISGLSTLVSGSYIEVDPGQGDSSYEFAGLEEPPQIRSDVPGTSFLLRADTLGTVSRGAPLYYRGIEVGQVLGYELAPGERALEVQVFVRRPYDRLVYRNSRFWNASGVRIGTGASGLEVDIGSLQSVLIGGIEFDTPRRLENEPPAAAGTEFALFASRDDATAASFTRKIPFLVFFDGSTRGLASGAPVEVRGIQVGTVADVRLAFSPSRDSLGVQALIEIEPERIEAVNADTGESVAGQANMEALIGRGLRAQVQTGNLLTGELYVDLDFYPDAPPAKMERIGEYPVLPSRPTDLEAIQATATTVLNKIAALPIDELVKSLNNTVAAVEQFIAAPETKDAAVSVTRTMTALEETMRGVNTHTGPLLEGVQETVAGLQTTLRQVRATLADVAGSVGPASPTQTELQATLKELRGAARSIRVFADYLERHPDALLRGKTGGTFQ